ncbi:MAG: nucleotidyltransferase domain-containing protein [Microbacteriaceae bacterium]
MDLSIPLRSFFSDIESRAFLALDSVASGMTGRQVAEVIHSNSPSHVRRALRKLENLGLVTSRQVGNAYVYETNKEHILWPIIQAINSSTEIFKQQIRELIEASTVPNATVWLYGSTVRKTSISKSDIDLVLIVPEETSNEALNELTAELSSCGELWTGNETNVYGISEQGLLYREEQQDPLFDSWMKEAIPIIGPSIQDLIQALHEQNSKVEHTSNSRTSTASGKVS